MFHSSELMAMVIGNQNYDFTEMEKNTEYKGEFNANHPVIRNFWKVFHQLDIAEKKNFLSMQNFVCTREKYQTKKQTKLYILVFYLTIYSFPHRYRSNSNSRHETFQGK